MRRRVEEGARGRAPRGRARDRRRYRKEPRALSRSSSGSCSPSPTRTCDAASQTRPRRRRPLRARSSSSRGAPSTSSAEPRSFDAVVCTLVLCSVRDVEQSLAEFRRVLRPEGKLVFLEHVAATEPSRLAWQRRTEPLWKLVAGNCHLCRETAASIEAAGFRFDRITRESARKALPIVRPTIRGVAIAP